MTPDELPSVLVLAGWVLPRTGGVERPCDVRGQEDLPQRTFMGELSEFAPSENGWTAIYRAEEEDTFGEITLEGDGITVTNTLRGECGGFLFMSASHPWMRIIQMAVGYPAPYVQAIDDAFEDLALSTCFPEGGTTLCGWPDGLMVTVVAPMALAGLPMAITAFAEGLESLGDDYMCQISLVRSRAMIEQLQDGDPDDAAIAEFERVVVGQAGWPLVEDVSVGRDESHTWLSAKRLQYTLLANCPLRCVHRTVRYLQRRGVINPRAAFVDSLAEGSWGAWVAAPCALFEFGNGFLCHESSDGTVRVRLEAIPPLVPVRDELLTNEDYIDAYNTSIDQALWISGDSRRVMEEWTAARAGGEGGHVMGHRSGSGESGSKKDGDA